jgi:hypothetical protein
MAGAAMPTPTCRGRGITAGIAMPPGGSSFQVLSAQKDEAIAGNTLGLAGRIVSGTGLDRVAGWTFAGLPGGPVGTSFDRVENDLKIVAAAFSNCAWKIRQKSSRNTFRPDLTVSY